MKLPDFRQCVEINQLMVSMGVSSIPTLPEVRFEKETIKKIVHEKVDLEDVKIGERLIDSAIPANKSEIAGKPGSFLEYKGRKVCAYIRDQRAAIDFYSKKSTYRYHLCNCSTLRSMKNIGRENRYLVTQRSDGLFEAHDLTVTPIKSGLVRMQLCQNCIQILREKGIYFSPFSLKKYYGNNDSYTPRTIRTVEEVRQMQTYDSSNVKGNLVFLYFHLIQKAP